MRHLIAVDTDRPLDEVEAALAAAGFAPTDADVILDLGIMEAAEVAAALRESFRAGLPRASLRDRVRILRYLDTLMGGDGNTDGIV